jgi:predicted Rossmann fold nucleotide-binding protein DprA/Smf involved in DNA uptake
MNIAIVGSRKYPYLDDVRRLVQLIDRDDQATAPGYRSTVISGGAEGVDKAAENEAIRLGMLVLSFRVEALSPEEYVIVEWHLGAQKPYWRHCVEKPTWANYESALMYRNSLIIEAADRVVAFRIPFSRGTSLAVDFAHAYKKPLREYGLGEFERLQVA